MPTTLTKQAIEKGTYIIDLTFTDEDGATVAINSGGTWKLTNRSGHVINSRTGQVLAAASTASIVLSGNDLSLPAGVSSEERLVTVEATYDSDAGSNLPLRDQVAFTVVNLTAVT